MTNLMALDGATRTLPSKIPRFVPPATARFVPPATAPFVPLELLDTVRGELSHASYDARRAAKLVDTMRGTGQFTGEQEQAIAAADTAAQAARKSAQEAFDTRLDTGTESWFLREYATHAARDSQGYVDDTDARQSVRALVENVALDINNAKRLLNQTRDSGVYSNEQAAAINTAHSAAHAARAAVRETVVPQHIAELGAKDASVIKTVIIDTLLYVRRSSLDYRDIDILNNLPYLARRANIPLPELPPIEVKLQPRLGLTPESEGAMDGLLAMYKNEVQQAAYEYGRIKDATLGGRGAP